MITIAIAKPHAHELSYRLSTILDESELLEETVAEGVTRDELRAAMHALDRKGGSHSFSAAMWRVLREELRCIDTPADALYVRIAAALAGEPLPVPRVKPLRPARAAGNISTPHFSNTSHYPDALVKQMLAFILEGKRLPAGCQITIRQTAQPWCSGLAYFARRPHGYGGKVRRPRGGSVHVHANVPHRIYRLRGGKGGYIPFDVYGSLEDFFSVLAHEVRHVFQGYRPLYRECRKVRRHIFGTRAKLTEIDASLFEIRTLRRFRREWPAASPRVLPLP